VSGAIWERSLREILVAVGFADVRFHGWSGYRTSGYTQGGLVTAKKS